MPKPGFQGVPNPQFPFAPEVELILAIELLGAVAVQVLFNIAGKQAVFFLMQANGAEMLRIACAFGLRWSSTTGRLRKRRRAK